MAEVPSTKKPATKGLKPDVATPAKPVAAAPVVAPKALAKPPVVKRVVAKPVVAKPAPVAVRKVAPVKVVAAMAAAPKIEMPEAAAPKVDAVKTQTKIASPRIATPVAARIVAATPTKGFIMNDTIKTATEDMQNRATAMFGDMNTRAKDAMAKGTKAIEELVEFSKGNVEAMVASGRVAAKGAEEIAKYSADYGRGAVEKANATAKQFAAVKSPTEFFQLQGEVAKQTMDALVAEGAKFTEHYLKLIGEISQPISNRVAVAAEKVKTTIAA